MSEERIGIKLAVLEERMTTLASLFEAHVKSDADFMTQIRSDLRGLQDWKIKLSVWATIGSAIGGFVSSLLLKWLA